MTHLHNRRRTITSLVLFACTSLALATVAAQSGSPRPWWSPGQGMPLASLSTYDNERGQLGVLNASGQLETKGHPFFEPIGSNGRACVTCHQPADAMSLSVRSIRERWAASNGKDPLFAAVDGMNCPNLPPDDPRSHSLLLERGLIRVSLPWPPRRPDGTRIDPEFTIEVVRDPSGCNMDAVYGINSANPSISVFRRPRPVANTKYTTHQNFGVSPFIGKNGMPAATDPLTGKPTSMNLMSDARAPTLAVQAEDAARSHLQIAGSLSAAQIARIVEFERQVYVAQVASTTAGSLVEADGPPAFGPRNLAAGDAGVLGNNTTRYVFPLGGKWAHMPHTNDERERARRGARIDRARARRVHVPHVLDQGLDASQHSRARQPDQAYVRHVPRDAHDRHGHRKRLDGHRHHQPALGFRGTAQSVERGEAADAAVPRDVQTNREAASLPRPRHLHAGSGASAHLGAVQRCGHDRHAAVPRAIRTGTVFLEWLGRDAS